MAIVVTPSDTVFSGYTILGTSDQGLEVYNPYNRNIPFNMIINSAFTEDNSTQPLAFSDAEDFIVFYPLVDRLNKPIQGNELYKYAGTRRCIQCIYSPIYKVVKVCSCIDPIPLQLPEPDKK